MCLRKKIIEDFKRTLDNKHFWGFIFIFYILQQFHIKMSNEMILTAWFSLFFRICLSVWCVIVKMTEHICNVHTCVVGKTVIQLIVTIFIILSDSNIWTTLEILFLERSCCCTFVQPQIVCNDTFTHLMQSIITVL